MSNADKYDNNRDEHHVVIGGEYDRNRDEHHVVIGDYYDHNRNDMVSAM